MTRRPGLDRLIAPKPSPERDWVLAMDVERLLHPASKLATTRRWHTTTLAGELDVGDAAENWDGGPVKGAGEAPKAARSASMKASPPPSRRRVHPAIHRPGKR